MSQHSPKPITEGYVGQYPSSDKWWSGQFAYPNQGVFYGSAKQAMRQCGGKEGRAYKVTVTYEEVDVNGDPLAPCPTCGGRGAVCPYCDIPDERDYHTSCFDVPCPDCTPENVETSSG